MLWIVTLQNKCTRYWPDTETTKDVGPFRIKHMKETEFTDYTLREFEMTSETNVSVTTYFISMLFIQVFYDVNNVIYVFPLFCSTANYKWLQTKCFMIFFSLIPHSHQS